MESGSGGVVGVDGGRREIGEGRERRWGGNDEGEERSFEGEGREEG